MFKISKYCLVTTSGLNCCNQTSSIYLALLDNELEIGFAKASISPAEVSNPYLPCDRESR